MKKNRGSVYNNLGKNKKISDEERRSVKQLEAKTENHKEYIRSILDNDITVCIGPAGCGKSYIVAGVFSQLLHSGKYDQIIATRPLVCAGKDIGSLPGEMDDKIAPYLKPIEQNIKNFLGIYNYGQYFNEKRIRYEPLEVMRGATFDNSLMILDEAQNCTLEQIKMFITRMGENSKVVVNGDIKQTDIRDLNGLITVVEKLANIEGVGICRLTINDIQRNGILAKILKALEE
jgi:phosphate starvation-inducible PhoH-like protein